MWSYRVADLKDPVKLKLQDGWKLNVVEVTSGDSGKKYWIQVEWNEKGEIVLTTCQCREGYFNICISYGRACCKHVDYYLEAIT